MMIAAAVAFAGCNKNDDNTDPDNGGNGSPSSGLSIDKTTIDAAYTAGTYPLQVTATQAWSAEANAAATWCTLSPNSYAGSRAVTVSVAENPTVGVQRAATVTFTSGTLTRAVGVTQAAIAPVLTTDKTTIDATAGAASYSVGVTSNTDWTATVSAGATWCTFAGTPGNGNGSVTVNVALNAATVTRSATVTLAAGTLTRAVDVTQAALTTPPYAASTQTWVFGDQTWSDAIHIPDCNKSSFTNSYTDPHCRSYTLGENTWYYYNWAYVSQKVVALCPSPWRVPSQSDFITLVSNTNYSTLISDWGYGGYCNSGGTLANQGSGAYYWSSSEIDSSYAYTLYYLSSYVYPQIYGNKNYGQQVRCVK
jgi:uncharacterized protein (TIGR02145 family)